MSKIDHRLGRPLRTQKSPQKAVQVYISENDFAHLVTVFCMVIIQNARPLELRAPPSQGGFGEVSRAITQVFLLTHFTSGEPALVTVYIDNTDPISIFICAPGHWRVKSVRLKQGATSMPTNGMKVRLSFPLSI